MGGGIFFAATFYVTAAVALASALMVVVHRNPVISALYLVVCLFAVAVDYVLLQAHFLAVIQILLYAGAVLVLFLLIIMLLNLGDEQKSPGHPTIGKAIGVLAVVFLAFLLCGSLYSFGRGSKAPFGQDHKKLAILLVHLGAEIKDLPVKLTDQEIKAVTAEENALVAKATMTYTSNPKHLPMLELPPELSIEITDEKLPDLYQALAAEIAKKGEIQYLDVLPEFPNLDRDKLLAFVVAATRSRFNEYALLGTTESVGKALFKQWVLPFELSGLLLLSAILGVLLIARRAPKEEQS